MRVGDSGYPLEPWLLTPFSVVATPAERAYNDAHSKTRIIVERSFGSLKSRFRCLDKSGGILLYKPEKVAKIVVACVVLHNFCTRRKIPLPAADAAPQVDAVLEVNLDEAVFERADDVDSAVKLRRGVNQSSVLKTERMIVW